MADAQEQLDILVSDTTQCLDVGGDPVNQFVVGRASRVDLHITMPVTTAQEGGDKSTHHQSTQILNHLDSRKLPYDILQRSNEFLI